MNLGIYIQVPFCQTKCTYCNFQTGVVSALRFAPYARAVQTEIRSYRERLAKAGLPLPEVLPTLAVDTVYFGGGTPSLLDPRHLREILDAIRETFACDFAEVTLEADPETVESGKAEAWASAGINRISFGVQSFSDAELQAAGRMHRRADVYRAMAILHATGLTNVSFDLIAGLPHQTNESWCNSLQELVTLAPKHASVYLLEVDEGSRLGSEILRGGQRYSAAAVPSDEAMADFYDGARKTLGAAGYKHYEISNFALAGFASRHNLNYWRREPYLGFGAGAHSFSGSQRWANTHDAAAYVTAVSLGMAPIEQLESVSESQALEEELFLGLRQLAGIDLERLQECYGVTLTARFRTLESIGLIEREGNVIRLAPDHLSISNEVFVELMR